MRGRDVAGLLFLVGLGLILWAVLAGQPVGQSAMLAGQAINDQGAEAVGAANLVTAVLLAYRGLDTLGELTILFVAATAAGLVLGRSPKKASPPARAGFVLRGGADLVFPFLVVLGAYLILHGHLTPGGGFQGGAILAAAFFIPWLARPDSPLDHRTAALVEGLAGTAFIAIGLTALAGGGAFLTPLLGSGEPGALVSAGTLPLLYLAVGLKVGAELAGLITRLAEPGQ
jgi:multicomponent Na+:H+ antiporter subunit B